MAAVNEVVVCKCGCNLRSHTDEKGKVGECFECPRGVCRRFSAVRKSIEPRPTVVTLCGSTKFKEAFEKVAKAEGLAGRVVLSVCFYGHVDPDGPPTAEQKTGLDQLHFRKIDMSDEILVINVGGYVGESTRREIQYARRTGKKVRWLEGPSDDERTA